MKNPVSPPAVNSLEEVYLVHHDGRVMAHAGQRRPTTDYDLVGSLFVALADFAKESLGFTKGLRALDFGPQQVLVERLGNSLLVAVTRGANPEKALLRLAETLADIEARLGSDLSCWDGDRSRLAPVQKVLERLVGPNA